MNAAKACELAIEALMEKRKKYAASASAARYGFPFGEKAAARMTQINEAIEVIGRLKEQEDA